ncbi:DNA-binding response OmpR family regulator [Anaerotaenia torta]|uniref:response regulator transcription factor n=1 Tax=Anaerotaenia torta TaxID=433293 RepID=UPI003D1C52E6
MQSKLLIVDDDKELLKMLKYYFEVKGYLIYTASDGKEALEKMDITPDLILLDINMPHINGIELCKRIRNKVACPILFLTAKVEEQDIINGLLSGGDDYITKPFRLKELEARIAAHIAREGRNREKSRIKFIDNLSIDFVGRTVHYCDNEINLTKMEYEIVDFLASHAGQVFDKESIYEKLWGYDGEGDSRIVTELIRRVRKKFSQYTQQEFIETVWGCGYKWSV